MLIPNFHDPFWCEVSELLGTGVTKISNVSHSTSGPTCLVSCNTAQYFAKFSSNPDVLSAEYDGLTALVESNTIRVPKPVVFDTLDSVSVLVSEFIDLSSRKSNYPRFAAELFALHSTHGTSYGWHRDNYIGHSPQINTQCDNWPQFFLNHRIIFQLNLAWQNGYSEGIRKLGEKIPDAISSILRDHHPKPSLLHGDLWGGNHSFDATGVPVIYDPAVYFGDAEADLAMTRLFGSLPESFYSAYQELNPLADGWQLRSSVYNLYHILNHLNIFGKSYQSHAEHLMKTILCQVS